METQSCINSRFVVFNLASQSFLWLQFRVCTSISVLQRCLGKSSTGNGQTPHSPKGFLKCMYRQMERQRTQVSGEKKDYMQTWVDHHNTCIETNGNGHLTVRRSHQRCSCHLESSLRSASTRAQDFHQVLWRTGLYTRDLNSEPLQWLVQLELYYNYTKPLVLYIFLPKLSM